MAAKTWRILITMATAAAVVVAPTVASADSTGLGPHGKNHFDVEAHRGGIGLHVESTLGGFANALELGVSTLELDIQITADGAAVVTHDRQVTGAKCLDTAPATPGDPEFPYVGKFVKDLTLAQVKTLDCGSIKQADFPNQELEPGATMPTLAEVFALVDSYDAKDVQLNIETKVEAGAPQETAPREEFVNVVADEIRSAGYLNRVTIQSFDWGSLRLMHEVEPKLPLVALIDPGFLQIGQTGYSPWLGGVDIDSFGGDPVPAAKAIGADIISPVHGLPQDGSVDDPGYTPFTRAAMVAEAHDLGMTVVPWTIDDTATMNKLIDDGVDGIITNYPDLLREVMTERGLKLPPAYAPAG